MQRREFIRTLIGGVVAGAAVRTWPFRVYSFPPNLSIYSNTEDAVIARMEAHMRIIVADMDREFANQYLRDDYRKIVVSSFTNQRRISFSASDILDNSLNRELDRRIYPAYPVEKQEVPTE